MRTLGIWDLFWIEQNMSSKGALGDGKSKAFDEVKQKMRNRRLDSRKKWIRRFEVWCIFGSRVFRCLASIGVF
jgi:hypothetical protein